MEGLQKNFTLSDRSVLVGISLLAIFGGGIYFDLFGASSMQGNGSGQETQNATSSAVVATTTSCAFETDMVPKHSPIIINEIAWMGTKDKPNDEWIELKNLSESTSSMAGWELINENRKIKAVMRSGAKIAPGGFYLLERGSEDFLQGIRADTFFIGSLKNSGDSFRLFDKGCGLVDQVMASSGWPAGDDATRKTMERDSMDFSWHTSSVIGGTPKAENTRIVSKVASSTKFQVAASALIGSVSNPTITKNTYFVTTPISPSNSTSTVFSANSSINHIYISQVQITGGTGKTNYDFIELYNPTELSLDLKGYRLVKRAQNGIADILIKSWKTDSFIPAGGFYLWANSDFKDIQVEPDATTTATLSPDEGVALRYGANDTGVVIDSVAWGRANSLFASGAVFPTNPDAGQSLIWNSVSRSYLLQSSTPRNSHTIFGASL